MPEQIDLVVGIPRSGIVSGGFLSVALNIPLTDLAGLLDGRLFEVGKTKERPDLEKALSPDRTVVVIDDAIGSGRAMREARERIEAAGLKGNFFFCTVYCHFSKHPDVDLVMEEVESPVLFEWNVMHSSLLDKMCFDIDGLLCMDCPVEADDDGPRYRAFLETARPLYKPTRQIGYLVTSRKEKYRPETEAWLQKQGIVYRELIMRRPEDEGQSKGCFKAGIYKSLDTILFAESHFNQAQEIANLSGKPALSIETQHVVYPNFSYDSVTQSFKMMPLYMRNQWGGLHNGNMGRIKNYLRRVVGNDAYASLKSMVKRRGT